MSKETMIIFVYDTEYCKDETYDPINAVLYFHPSWVSDVQKVALCGQLMGTSQFLKNCFFAPKIIALQNGKFVFKEFGRFLVAVGTDRNISDFLLQHRAKLLASLIEFFHRDFQTIYDHFPSSKHHKNVSDKLYHIFGTYLPILHHNGNIFQNVPKLRIPKIASNIFLDAMQTLQSCQQTKGVLGGAILYHNKVVATQLSNTVTKNIVLTDPHRIKSTAEMINVNFHVPVGVQMIVVYIPSEQYQMLSADAARSQNLQTQILSNNVLPPNFQKQRKMKRDRSIIFTNIPEENNGDQVETSDDVEKPPTKPVQRPTNLQLKEVVPKDYPESGFASITHEEANRFYNEFIGRTSVCSTPMTENKVLHGIGIMSICADPIDGPGKTLRPLRLRNSIRIDLERLFSTFSIKPKKIDRRNSYVDVHDNMKKSSKKFSLRRSYSSYKAGLAGESTSSENLDTDDEEEEKQTFNDARRKKIVRAISDPMYPVYSDNNQPISNSLYDELLEEYEAEWEERQKFEAEEEERAKIRANKKKAEAAIVDAGISIVENPFVATALATARRFESKTSMDRKSLRLPLKTHGDMQSDHYSINSFERRRMSGIQLTPLMAKLSILALTDDRGFRDTMHFGEVIPPIEHIKKRKSNTHKRPTTDNVLNGFHRVELYVCGQQNMTMVLLLEQGSGQKQEIVQAMFDKCVAKLGKMETQLYQTLNVNMMQGLSEGVYSLTCVDSKWDTRLNVGPWTPLDHSFLEHIHSDLTKNQQITDMFLRTNDCTLYGYRSGRTEFFFKESAQNFTGIPPPSDPMGTIGTRAKTRLEEDLSIVLF